MDSILNLKMSLRRLRKSLAFSAVIILTIAIVTGTSIVVFSYIDALLLSPLPFKEADRLVRIHSVKGGEKGHISYPEFLEMQNELVHIEELAVYRDGGRYNLHGDGQPPEELTTTFASSNLFKLLGVDPIIGNHWPETLDRRGSHTVMITHEFWQRRFKSNEEVEGLEITLDGFTYNNYGVLPAGFSFPGKNEAFRAMAYADFVVDARGFRPCIGLARLKPGVTLVELNEELKVFAESQQQRHQESNLGISFVAEPLSELFLGEINGYLLLIGAAALFLLIIAAVNISNLIVSRAIRRSRETVLRKVLGSTNISIIKSYTIDSFILSIVGSLVGLLLAWYLISLTHDLVDPYLPHWINVGINLNVVLYTMATAVVLAIATGVVPWFFQVSKSSLVKHLKDGQQTTGSKRQHQLQKGLAILQIFVSVLLLVGGALLFKSFNAAQEAQLGFQTKNKQTFRIALSWFRYGSPEKKKAFFEESLRRIDAIPGIESVAMNTVLPLSGIVKTSTQAQTLFTAEGQSEVDQTENPFISIQRITPNYFDAMDIDFERGDTFDDNDSPSHGSQVVVDKQLADNIWPGESALGKRIKFGNHGSDEPYLTVIGVATNVKHQSITGANIPSVYVSLLANTTTDGYYVIESRQPLASLETAIREAIFSIDENQPLFEFMSMSDRVDQMNWQSKVSSMLFLTIAIIGSIIAAIGLFSVLTFILILKVKELALRRVLGATDGGILQLILKDMMKTSGIGIILGLLLAPILLQPIIPFLFEVNIIDMAVYVLVAVALLIVSVVAAFAPSWKALFINPIKVLRKD